MQTECAYRFLETTIGRAIDAVWLRQPESLRLRVPSELRREVRRELSSARARLRDARRIDPGSARNDAVQSTLRTLVCTVGRASSEKCVDAAAALETGMDVVRAGLPGTPLIHALSYAGAHRGKVPLTEAQFADVLELCEWVDGLLDTRSERARRLQRRAGWVVLIVMVAALARASFGPKNLAFGRDVTASSICPLTPPPTSLMPRLGRVVDGVRYEGPAVGTPYGETAFAVCTNWEVHPWLMVDLGSEHVLSDAAVYGRSDCCWGDGLPLAIQISSDNEHFETVAQRDTPFTAASAWKASLGGRRARYVRLFGPSSTPEIIVVSELKIHGH